MNKKQQFISFLEGLKGHEQDALIESVKKGFQVFYEGEEKVITYKGKGITKTFPAGYYRWYSDKEGRFLVYDDLEMVKADIDKELLEERAHDAYTADEEARVYQQAIEGYEGMEKHQ